MNKLQLIKNLYINITSLFVYSSKYCVRKSCTRLLIIPPTGCKNSNNELETIVINLFELNKKHIHSNGSNNDKNNKYDDYNRYNNATHKNNNINNNNNNYDKADKTITSNNLDPFFVGEILLNKNINFPLEIITNEILKKWLDGSNRNKKNNDNSINNNGNNRSNDNNNDNNDLSNYLNCLHIEIQSCINPSYDGISNRKQVCMCMCTLYCLFIRICVYVAFVNVLTCVISGSNFLYFCMSTYVYKYDCLLDIVSVPTTVANLTITIATTDFTTY